VTRVEFSEQDLAARVSGAAAAQAAANDGRFDWSAAETIGDIFDEASRLTRGIGSVTFYDHDTELPYVGLRTEEAGFRLTMTLTKIEDAVEDEVEDEGGDQ